MFEYHGWITVLDRTGAVDVDEDPDRPRRRRYPARVARPGRVDALTARHARLTNPSAVVTARRIVTSANATRRAPGNYQ
jgi:hypothetical protein